MTSLRLAHITKHFGPTQALDDVSFDVSAGEVHALLGENGAGKTTLMRIAYGMLAPDHGEVVVHGEKREARGDRIASPMAARALGIGMVHQHFTSIEALTVAENIALAAGWRGGSHHQRAAEVIARLALPLDPTARARDLSVQLRQRLEIVQALASNARILLLDEPTAVLAPREVAELLDLVRRFRDQGGAVVLISHKLADVAQVADRITVLRRGQVTLSGAAREYDAAALSRAMIGTEPGLPPAVDRVAIERRDLRGAARPDPEREIRVELQEWGIVLHAGEIVGIAAIEGNGQRELLRAIGGLHRTPAIEVTGSVAFVPEDRSREALIPAFSLTANLLLGNLDRASGWIDWSHWQRETAALLERHDVRASGVSDRAASLSGGNQQKFIIARALARRPDVLVVEHPTRGLDVTATAATRSALREAAASGSCVVIHDADLDEVLTLATRLLVMSNGVVRELEIDTPRGGVGDAMLGLV